MFLNQYIAIKNINILIDYVFLFFDIKNNKIKKIYIKINLTQKTQEINKKQKINEFVKKFKRKLKLQ